MIDLHDYTTLLAGAGVISWDQAAAIQNAIDVLSDARAKNQVDVETEFWEGQYHD